MNTKVALIEHLANLEIEPRSENAWEPHGTLRVEEVVEGQDECEFDLLIPTERNDIWDYIWRSECEAGTTEKVALFQAGGPVIGSRVVAVAREGDDERFDGSGPDQYRVTFSVPYDSLQERPGLEVCFFWSGEVMSRAGPAV